MKRKDFIKYGSAGFFSTTIGMDAIANASNIQRAQDVNEYGATGKEVIHRKAMVCASEPLAVAAGYDVLKSGGNAIDAAVAVNAMLCLTEPMMCGPGGDLFAMVWSEKDKKLFGLNASGRSPYNWTVTEARRLGLNSIPSFGPLSWSVPGCVSGWDELLKSFGTRTFAHLVQPAIIYATEGFPVSRVIAEGWKPENGATDYATLNGTFLKDKRLQAGDIFHNHALAKTFQLLAKDGLGSFYQGEIADRIVQFSKQYNGRFDSKDLADHKADWIEPVTSSYRGYDVWQLPPNGQGIVVLQMLNLLEQFDNRSWQPNSAEGFHLFLEAKKLSFADRAIYYADTDYSKAAVNDLISKDYARERSKLIDWRKASRKTEAGRIRNSSNTIYLTVADDQGNMVSLIQSLYSPWGSQYAIRDLGFALQNRGALFSLNDKALNKLEPHKRPLHTIIPSFITQDQKPVFSFGVTGGDFQPQGQVQILLNIIDHKMDVQKAGDQLRLWHRESFEFTNEQFADSGTIIAEPGFPAKVKQDLINKGHHFSAATRWFGGYQGIWRKDEPRLYYGASDFRKDGCAFGY